MKRNTLLVIFVLLLCTLGTYAGLDARFNFNRFYSETDGPFIETYLSVIGSSVHYTKNDEGLFEAQVGITYLFKQDGKISEYRKIQLISPSVEDTSGILPNFLDVQRIPLPNGNYTLEIKIKDQVKKSKQFIATLDLSIDYSIASFYVSDIEPVEKYLPGADDPVLSKNGYTIVPYVSSFYPENLSQLVFYTEVYKFDSTFPESEKLLLKYYIEIYENNKALDSYNKFKRIDALKTNVLLGKFDISKLPTGNYNLVVEIRNRENKILAQNKLFFQRKNDLGQLSLEDIDAIDASSTFSGKITNPDTLIDYIHCLYPISEFSERRFADNIIGSGNIRLMQQYFYNFWVNRNPQQPEKGWLDYKVAVDMVNSLYSTRNKRGYETDRGRVFLQYGAPNIVRERKSEPKMYPFEIWQYYELNGKKDQKFLFYNPDIVSIDYTLLHSNVEGEIYTKNWIYHLMARTVSPTNLTDDLDNPNGVMTDENWGSEALRLWENP